MCPREEPWRFLDLKRMRMKPSETNQFSSWDEQDLHVGPEFVDKEPGVVRAEVTPKRRDFAAESTSYFRAIKI